MWKSGKIILGYARSVLPAYSCKNASKIPEMLIGIQHYPRLFLDMLEVSCLLFLAKSRQDSSNVNWNPAYPRLYLDMLEVSCLLILAKSRQDSSNVIWNPALSKIILGYARSILPAYSCKKQARFLKCYLESSIIQDYTWIC